MYTWHLTKNLTLPLDPAWDRLAELALGKEVHQDRKTGFILSRMALKNALKAQGINLSVDELLLSNYHQLHHSPDLTLSLSHTKHYGAALIGKRKDFLSLGVDVEHEERLVKESIKERIAHPEDASLRNIELWCLKEAAFKALMNTGRFEKPLEFSSIEIGDHQWLHSPSGLAGEWRLEKIDQAMLAMAFLRN